MTGRYCLRVLTIVSVLFLGGCGESADSTSAVQQALPIVPVASIVFVDQAECCKCTRTRINDTWDALKSSLEKSGKELPIRRIHSDKAEAIAAPFLEIRPMMVIPGVYFLDADGALIEMLQGEVAEEQIAPLLNSGAAPNDGPPQNDGPGLKVDEAHRTCEDDADCDLVMTQCSCDCGVGVNKKYYDEYFEKKTTMCVDYDGIKCKMDCADASCVDSICTYGGK